MGRICRRLPVVRPAANRPLGRRLGDKEHLNSKYLKTAIVQEMVGTEVADCNIVTQKNIPSILQHPVPMRTGHFPFTQMGRLAGRASRKLLAEASSCHTLKPVASWPLILSADVKPVL